MDDDLYTLRAEKNKRSRKQYQPPGMSNYRNRNWFRDRSKGQQGDQMVRRNLEANPENIQVIDHMIEQERLGMILSRNPTNIVNIVIRMIILGNNGRGKPMERMQKGLRR